ncbi:MAG: hypothetical protein WAK71_05050 [Streptosporangiaceae bacterium]
MSTAGVQARPSRALAVILAILGILAVILGVLFFAGALNSVHFLVGSMHTGHHVVRGAVSVVVGVVLLALGWFTGRAR